MSRAPENLVRATTAPAQTTRALLVHSDHRCFKLRKPNSLRLTIDAEAATSTRTSFEDAIA